MSIEQKFLCRAAAKDVADMRRTMGAAALNRGPDALRFCSPRTSRVRRWRNPPMFRRVRCCLCFRS